MITVEKVKDARPAITKSDKKVSKTLIPILPQSMVVSKKPKKVKVHSCNMSELGFHRWTHLNIHQLSKALSSKIRGWINDYGKFHFTEIKRAFLHLNRRLDKWAFNKYERFKRRKAVYYARLRLRQVSKNYQYLFPHWRYGFMP